MMRSCFLALVLACTAAESAGGDLNRVRGSVVDRTGSALAHVRIFARDVRGKVAALATSDTHGLFTLELTRGRYSVAAALEGFTGIEGRLLEVGPEGARELALVMQVSPIENQVVVTANRSDTQLSHVGSTLTVLSGERLRSQGVTWVADALRRVPGLSVAQSGGYGQLASLFVRGGESDYAKVLIDGVPVNEPGGAFNFGALPLAGIDRIEVVRGPQSALFGSDAIAGVIQIFTSRGQSGGESSRIGTTVEAGSYSSFRYSGSLQGRGEWWDFVGSFSRADTDGDVPNGSFNSETMAANVGLRTSPSTSLRFVVRTDAGRSGIPGQWAFHRPEQDEYYRTRGVAGGVSLVQQANARWTQTLAYSLNDLNQHSVDPGDSGSYASSYQGRVSPFTSSDYPFRTLNQSRRHRVSYQADFLAAGNHLVSAGGDYEREAGVVGDPDFEPLHATRDNAGVFIQDQFSHANRLFATAGVRLERNASFGVYATPRVSAAFHARGADPAAFWGITKFRASFGLGIKEPTLLESFSNSPFFMGNPELRPEKSTSFDAGVEQYFASGRGALELTWFDNRFRDQIGFAITDFESFEGSFFNIGRARARGVEIGVVSPLGRGLDISAAYTLLLSRVLESSTDSDPAFAAGQELFRRPRHSGQFELRWSPARWTLSASALMVGNRVDSDFSGLGMTRNPGHATLNLSAAYRLSGRFSLYATVNNALNRFYMDVLGYPSLRAHFRVGLRAGV